MCVNVIEIYLRIYCQQGIVLNEKHKNCSFTKMLNGRSALRASFIEYYINEKCEFDLETIEEDM